LQLKFSMHAPPTSTTWRGLHAPWRISRSGGQPKLAVMGFTHVPPHAADALSLRSGKNSRELLHKPLAHWLDVTHAAPSG
jgi:hypothetical protein